MARRSVEMEVEILRSTMSKTDLILAMARTASEDYMQQIVLRLKTHEFRKRRYPTSVLRFWFYETSPINAITYICEVSPAHSRSEDGPLGDEEGIGNRDYNEFDPSFEGYEYAYRVKSCWRVVQPVGLDRLMKDFGLGGAPRGMVYVPEELARVVAWDEQELVWSESCEA
ncbi:hypothetical protein JCM24511_01222 [Saitozyma sp. JCM 24511]|nr:hypothetical protein JCM24511_01222 [Saitozyma sp. JCM 24511]